MKFGIISDVHGNLEALRVALETLTRELEVDKLFFCGDLVGYGPEPNACIDALREELDAGIKGNHDAAVVGELGVNFFNRAGSKALKWTKREITKDNKAYLEELPVQSYLPEEGISLVHGSSADSLTHYITRKADAIRSTRLAEKDFAVQLFGHTHLPVVYEIANENVNEYRIQGGKSFNLNPHRKYLINPGSVGQPRDGNWKTSFAMLELNDNLVPQNVNFFREEYPAEKTRQKILDANLPKQLGDRLLEGR